MISILFVYILFILIPSYSHMGVSTNGGTPIPGWFTDDLIWGYPHDLANLHMTMIVSHDSPFKSHYINVVVIGLI